MARARARRRMVGTVAPRLGEDALVAEVVAKGGRATDRTRGAVFFEIDIEQARTLRAADKVLAAVSDAPTVVGWERRAVENLKERALADARRNAEEAWRTVAMWRRTEEAGAPERPVQFRATCRRYCRPDAKRHKQAYTSQEAAGAYGAGVHEATGWRVDLRAFNADVFIAIDNDTLVCAGIELDRDVVDGDKSVSVPLYAQRPWRRALLTTALRPSVAAALLYRAFGTPLPPGSVVVDPCCGALTIPLEAADGVRGVLALGADVDPDAVAAAAANESAPGGPPGACLLGQCDVKHRLSLRAGIADAVVSDLPFGKKCGKPANRSVLYERCARETARILRVGGRAVFLFAGRSGAADLVHGGGGALACLGIEGVTMEIPLQVGVFERV